jgi:hypothetical protein
VASEGSNKARPVTSVIHAIQCATVNGSPVVLDGLGEESGDEEGDVFIEREAAAEGGGGWWWLVREMRGAKS